MTTPSRPYRDGAIYGDVPDTTDDVGPTHRADRMHMTCVYCDEPIGYDVPFYVSSMNQADLMHTTCAPGRGNQPDRADDVCPDCEGTGRRFTWGGDYSGACLTCHR